MGAENITQAGINIPVEGERTRNFKLGMKAQAWLANKHGTIKRVYSKLAGEIGEDNQILEKGPEGDMTECQLEALVDIVYAGLLRDAERNKEPFTREDALNLVDDIGIDVFFAVIGGEQKASLPESEGTGDPTSAQA